MSTVIRIENLSKQYRLGVIGHGYLFRDLQSWWARLRGQEDPNSPVLAWSGQLNVRGDRVWALRGVSLEAEGGKVLGIIGRNGAGKTTLLKIISRITAPTTGEVKIRGRVASLLGMGTGFHPELTGRENIFLNGAILGMTVGEIRRKFDEIVDFSGLEKFIDTPVKRYSSGMYVRLAFAVAAHLEPEILLVDEVLAVGDAGFQKKCLGKIGEITQEGRTVLFVSHNMDAISTLCDRVAWIDQGEILAEGQVKEIIDQYIDSIMTAGPEDRKAGEPAGKIFSFKGYHLVDDEGQVVDFARVGAPFNIVIHYGCQSEIRSARLMVDLVFGHAKVPRLFSCPYEFTDAELARLPLEGSLICRIPALPLAPGIFDIRYAATVNGHLADKVAALVMVRENEDLFLAGRPGMGVDPKLSRYRCQFLVDFQWSLGSPGEAIEARRLGEMLLMPK